MKGTQYCRLSGVLNRVQSSLNCKFNVAQSEFLCKDQKHFCCLPIDRNARLIARKFKFFTFCESFWTILR